MGRKRRRGQWREKRGKERRTGKGEGERKEGACTHSVFVCCSYCFLLLFLLPFEVNDKMFKNRRLALSQPRSHVAV